MMNIVKTATILLFIFFAFVACSEEPDGLIDKDTYIDLIVEFELLRTIQRLEGDTLQTVQLKRSVLDNYNISYDQYERSYRYYMDDPETHRMIYREAIDRLNQEVGRLRNPVRQSENADQIPPADLTSD